jgi:hypothetical protein
MSRIILTNHAKNRLLERNIDFTIVKQVIKNPSQTKTEKNKIIIKTSYYL